MKQDYLNRLSQCLKDHQILDADMIDVMNDYDEMYEDALAKGKSDEEIEALLGEPEDVVKELLDTLRIRDFKVVRKRNNRLVALAPFIALIAFFLLGYLGDMWHPGWLVFLLVPIAGILGNVNKKEKFVALSPFIAVVVFIFLGVAYQAWHPGWLIFLLIPIAGVLTGARRKEVLLGISPFIALLLFILLGTYLDAWAWSWLFFLIVPILGAFYSRKALERYLLIPSILLAIGFYLYMYLAHDMIEIGLLGFILPFVVAIFIGNIRWSVHVRWSFNTGVNSMIVLCSVAAFLIVGLTVPQAWSWAWMILLLIPITSILIHRKRIRLTPIMPFVAVIVFFSLGYFFDLWHISWLAFLLIPMMGIIENTH